jgi:hypothetical protein
VSWSGRALSLWAGRAGCDPVLEAGSSRPRRLRSTDPAIRSVLRARKEQLEVRAQGKISPPSAWN